MGESEEELDLFEGEPEGAGADSNGTTALPAAVSASNPAPQAGASAPSNGVATPGAGGASAKPPAAAAPPAGDAERLLLALVSGPQARMMQYGQWLITQGVPQEAQMLELVAMGTQLQSLPAEQQAENAASLCQRYFGTDRESERRRESTIEVPWLFL